MDDVSPRILSRFNDYYCREARTLIPPRGLQDGAHARMRSNTTKRRRGVDDDVDGMCNAVQRVGAYNKTGSAIGRIDARRIPQMFLTVRIGTKQ